MIRLISLVAVVTMITFLVACGGSGSTPAPTGSGIKVMGSVQGLATSVSSPPVTTSKGVAKADYDPDAQDNCPAGPDNSFWTTPSAYKVKFKRVTLLGSVAAGTVDFDLINVTNIDDATEVDFVTNSTFASSTSYPPAGTYDGIEIEVFYVGEEVPMAVPAVNAAKLEDKFTVANYLTRGYFADVGNIQPRDVTIFADPATGIEAEYWINRQTDDPELEPYGLIAVSSTHPFQVLDLWHDPTFWCENGTWDTTGCLDGWRTPMSICTRTTADCDPTTVGTDFTFAMADGTGELVIPEGATGLYTITFNFDVSGTFTFNGDLNFNDPATESFGNFRVGYDCGYRIMFPDVSISFSKS